MDDRSARQPDASDGDATPLGALLTSILGELGVSGKLAECEVLLAWEEVAGPELAARARPTRVRNASLELAVPSAAWRTQLSFAKDDLVRRLNERVGRSVVSDIKLTNSPLEELRSPRPGLVSPTGTDAAQRARAQHERKEHM